MKDASEHVDVSNNNSVKDEDVLPKPMVSGRGRTIRTRKKQIRREKKKRYCSFNEQEPGLVQLCLAVRQILDKSRCCLKKFSEQIRQASFGYSVVVPK